MLLLAGCTSGISSSVEQIQPSESEPRATPEPSGDEEVGEPRPCQGSEQLAVEETVNSQTKAFAEGDFELAYSYASDSFQSNVSLGGFIEIIAGSYGPLISSSKLDFRNCVTGAGSGLALIDVRFQQSGNDVYALRYLLVDSPAGWKVQGASNLAIVGKGT